MSFISKFRDLFWFFLRVAAGAVFVYAGFSKIIEPVENFQAVLSEYPLIPSFFVPWIAYIAPWLELIFGWFFIVGYLPKISSAVLAGLAACFFTSLAGTVFFFGKEPMSCGCFGEGGIQLSVSQVLILDVFLFAVSIRHFFMKPWSLSLHARLK